VACNSFFVAEFKGLLVKIKYFFNRVDKRFDLYYNIKKQWQVKYNEAG